MRSVFFINVTSYLIAVTAPPVRNTERILAPELPQMTRGEVWKYFQKSEYSPKKVEGVEKANTEANRRILFEGQNYS